MEISKHSKSCIASFQNCFFAFSQGAQVAKGVKWDLALDVGCYTWVKIISWAMIQLVLISFSWNLFVLWLNICYTLRDLVSFVKFLKNVKNTHGGVLLLIKVQALACIFTKRDPLPRVFFTLFKLYKWYKSRKACVSYEGQWPEFIFWC